VVCGGVCWGSLQLLCFLSPVVSCCYSTAASLDMHTQRHARPHHLHPTYLPAAEANPPQVTSFYSAVKLLVESNSLGPHVNRTQFANSAIPEASLFLVSVHCLDLRLVCFGL